MGMDSYLYKTKRSAFDAYLNAESLASSAQFKNKSKIRSNQKKFAELTSKLVIKYPKLKSNMSYKNMAKTVTKEEISEVDRLEEECRTLSGAKFFDGVDTSPGELLAYWRKPFGLHHYIASNFCRGDDNLTRIELTRDNIRKMLTHMKRLADHPKLMASDVYFGGNDGYWDMDVHKQSIAKLEKILENYADDDVVYYWAWY